MQELDDMALLREYAARGSEQAFALLVSRRVHFVYSAALRQVRDPDLAAEITQAVFIILAQKAGRIRDGTVLAGWLFKTTRFVALGETRALAKRRRHEEAIHMQSENPSPAPDPLWEQMSPLLDEALAQLAEKDRHAVLLRFFENKNLAEVGLSLGAGEDTARKRVSRALEKLRKFLSKRGVVSTTAIIAGAMSANSVQTAPIALAKTVSAIAVAKGAVAGGSTLVLVKGALKLMAWTNTKTAVITAVVIAAATTSIVLQERQNTRLRQEVARLRQQTEPPAPTPAQNAPVDASAPAIQWQAVQSANHLRFIANLRALGLPEQVIRDIIIARLDRDYRQRIEKLYPAPPAYWQGNPHSVIQARAYQQEEKLRKEERELIGQLFGDEAVKEFDQVIGKAYGAALAVKLPAGKFDFLPPDKRGRLQDIYREYQEKQAEVNGKLGIGLLAYGEDRPRIKELDDWKDAAIKDLLSPEELTEYRLREGKRADLLRSTLNAFGPSEEEFRRITHVVNTLPVMTGDIDPTPEAPQKFQNALKQALGEQRYAEYKMCGDNYYQQFFDLAQIFELPRETARTVYNLKTAAEQQADAVRTDSTLSPEARQQALSKLKTITEASVSRILGAEALAWYRKRWGGGVPIPGLTWIDMLGRQDPYDFH